MLNIMVGVGIKTLSSIKQFSYIPLPPAIFLYYPALILVQAIRSLSQSERQRGPEGAELTEQS